MREFTKFDVLNYLEMDSRIVRDVLDRVIDGYWKKSNDQRVDEVHEVFDSVRKHLARQDAVMRSVCEDAALEKQYRKFRSYRDQINQLMEDMVFEHLDDEEFHSDLILLRGLISKLGRLESRKLFSQMREQMSDEEKEASEELFTGGLI